MSQVVVGDVIELGFRPAPSFAKVALPTLAEIASTEHQKTIAAAQEVLGHALICGAALKEARERVGASKWREWVEANTPMSYRTAAVYVRLSVYENRVLQEGYTSITAAIEGLKGLPFATNQNDTRGYPNAVKAEAKRMHREGASLSEIADVLGVALETVGVWVLPEKREEVKVRQKQRKLRSRKLKELERQENRAKAAKRAGGNLATAYSLLRKTLSEVDKAMEKATEPDVRNHLRQMMANLHKAEDECARALKVP